MTAPRRRPTRNGSRSPTSRTRSTARRRSGFTWPSLDVAPEVVRSIVGIVLMILGAVVLIGLMLPGQGALTDWVRDGIAPWFGTGRWILPFVLLGAGIYVERAPGARAGWGATLLGLAIGYVGLLGVIAVVVDGGYLDGRSGGRIGSFVAGSLIPLVTAPGALLISFALVVVGTLVTLNATLGELLSPARRAALGARSVLLAPRETGEQGAANGRGDRTNGAASPGRILRETDGRTGVPPVPVPVANMAAPPATTLGLPLSVDPESRPADAVSVVFRGDADRDGVLETGDQWIGNATIAYVLPPYTVLAQESLDDDGPAREMDHRRNAEIIEAKLASFSIPVRITGWNAGPVVTQYEVKPDDTVKVSKIEALSDDLAMALAAPTIRIEAPIPGRSVVGIEIPNTRPKVVGLRGILEDRDRPDGRLTDEARLALARDRRLAFALGRDVAGIGWAADLEKMPHLLIAGATGSGKSVMVNALIVSLLMRSTPDDLGLILIDMKGGVELASYGPRIGHGTVRAKASGAAAKPRTRGVPHLQQGILTESRQAKAALEWAVGEMERRYKSLAEASVRNIAAYNASRGDPADRLRYIVIIVDELADLMMRDGRSVEEPIVRLAQKARATGIHLVLATQRPSVNVVTGLIKANFPSRIAFAMASQIDSRTIIDTPGAERLIGRGDMLYQPPDLPKPVRLQGVFVSDAEISAVVDYWERQAAPVFDPEILAAADDPSTADGVSAEEDDADRLMPDAIDVIQEFDRASASLLQRRLRIGYARAARIIDQLEARGYVGKFDGSSARPVLRRDAPEALPSGGFDTDDKPDDG